MNENYRQLLIIPDERLDDINKIFIDPNSRIVNDFLAVVDKYGTPDEINAKAKKHREFSYLLEKVKELQPKYLDSLKWLEEQRDKNAFITIADYRRKILGERADSMKFNDEFAVTLEVSAAQYFPWVIEVAKRAIEQQSLMPGRFIRVRKMKEQELDGDLAAFSAAMQIIGASFVETLDTKGTDGSNVHLGGPETITGYFGGVGQPNNYALKWLDEY